MNPTPADKEPDPAELPRDLKQALQDAYPSPNGRIAAKVMEQIRAERQPALRQPAEEQRRADKAERRRHRHGLIMKYGGLAACMVILSGALVLASPLMDRTADEAAMADQQILMTAAEDCAAETVPETVYSTKRKSTTTAGSAADDAAEEVLTEAEEDVPMMLFSTRITAPTAEEAEPAAEEAVPAAVSILADAAEAAAADDPTAAPREAFLQYLIDEGYLTTEDFTRWQSTLEDADAWTTRSLCDAFQVDDAVYDTWLKK